MRPPRLAIALLYLAACFEAALVLRPTAVRADGILIGIAATPSADGVLRLPVNSAAAFSIAVMNVGPDAVQFPPLRNQVRAEPSGLPLVLAACVTEPINGQCVSPGPGDITEIRPGEVGTFSVFVFALGTIPLQPWTNRIVMTFPGLVFPPAPGATYLSVSIAVTTDAAP